MCSDQGGEFQTHQLINHHNQKGTIREFTVHDLPPQNRVAERGMQTRAERACTLLIASGLPRFLWEAMQHVTWVQNRSPVQALDGKTPYEMIHNKKLNLAGIQEFGAAAYVKDLKAGKLDAQAQLGWFVGYDSKSKGFRIYWPGKRSVMVESNVVFNESDVQTAGGTVSIPTGALSEGEKEIEKVIQYPDNPVENLEKAESNLDDINQPEKDPTDDDQEPKTLNTVPFHKQDAETVEKFDDESPQPHDQHQCSARFKGTYKGMTAAVTVLKDHDEIASIAEDDVPDEGYFNCFYGLPPDFAMLGDTSSDPQTLDEALRGPNAKEWQVAPDYEINQLEKLGMWVAEDLPPGQMAIPCSEVVKVKRGPNGKVQSYSVQIMAGGHRQVEGVDYTETFSAAAKMLTICAVLANAAHQDWEIEHVDVKCTYLKAPLKETIYMKPLKEVLKPGEEGKVLRLLKGLYGLKQAGRGWYLEMTRVFLKELNFKRSAIDHSMYYHCPGNEHTIVAVATDDMAVASKHAEDAVKFKSDIRKFWEITDHRPIKWFLGFKIKRDHEARMISINQSVLMCMMQIYPL